MQNYSRDKLMYSRTGSLYHDAWQIFQCGVKAASPYNSIKKAVKVVDGVLFGGGSSYDLKEYKQIYITGGGKGVVEMATAMESILDTTEYDYSGYVVTKYMHSIASKLKHIEVGEGIHNIAYSCSSC